MAIAKETARQLNVGGNILDAKLLETTQFYDLIEQTSCSEYSHFDNCLRNFYAPIGWRGALSIWGYALAWALVNDRIKLVAYRIFDHLEPWAWRSGYRKNNQGVEE
ncbi:MAG: hypothetical protein GWP06_07340 [Actinobacteria bacterium]|nr:hypothetical protein [Actinomycetota bacterium]